jgi:hypothetical protein
MNQPDEGSIRDQVKRAFDKGRRIQESVRDITLKALSRRELDGAAIKKVTGEALDAVREAATVHGASAKAAVGEAVAGVDQALSHAAQALKLSIQEAAGRAEKFSREDLARARASLAGLEKMFLGKLRDTAQAGRGAASAIFDDLAKHAQASGTAVGRQLGEMGALSARMMDAGRAQFEAGMKAAISSSAIVARAASGALAGLASALEEKQKNEKQKNENEKDGPPG